MEIFTIIRSEDLRVYISNTCSCFCECKTQTRISNDYLGESIFLNQTLISRYRLKKDNQKCWLVAWSILLGFFFFFFLFTTIRDFLWSHMERREMCSERFSESRCWKRRHQMHLYVEERLIMAEQSYEIDRQKREEAGQTCRAKGNSKKR